MAGTLTPPFHVAGFWAAFWGAIIVALVGWMLGVLVHEDRRKAGWPRPDLEHS